MKIRPLQDRILVKRVDEEETTSGGIIIPDSAKEKPKEGKVVALGDGKLLGYMVFGPRFQPVLLMILAPGAFITIGLLMGYFNVLDARMKRRRAEAEEEKG